MNVAREDLEGYDIIGDIHGCADALRKLLDLLGYKVRDGVYQHPARKVVFLGDILDRGPRIRETVKLVSGMVNAGKAWLVVGNHEYNAICYCTCFPDAMGGDYLRSRGKRNRLQFEETLQQYAHYPEEFAAIIHWLRQQPLCLEFEDFNVVHACWDQEKVTSLKKLNPDGNLASDDFLKRSAMVGTDENRIVERLLKGTDIILPEGCAVTCSDGVSRTRFRTRFWVKAPEVYGDVFFQADPLPEGLMQRRISDEERQRLVYYGAEEKPLFVGHYWRCGEPDLIQPNIACLDYSAVNKGLLVAYRMNRETKLKRSSLCWVEI